MRIKTITPTTASIRNHHGQCATAGCRACMPFTKTASWKSRPTISREQETKRFSLVPTSPGLYIKKQFDRLMGCQEAPTLEDMSRARLQSGRSVVLSFVPAPDCSQNRLGEQRDLLFVSSRNHLHEKQVPRLRKDVRFANKLTTLGMTYRRDLICGTAC